MFKILASSILSVSIALTPLGARTATTKRPLADADIDAIATLLKLEDTRQFDATAFSTILASTHPEVRRRAAMSLGRIVNEGTRPALASLRDDADPEIRATVAWATGQQKDTAALPWLAAQLMTRGQDAVGHEAAQALGKIITPESFAALSAYLAKAPLAAPATIVGEALLSAGRFQAAANQTPIVTDVAPIVRWATAPNAEVRWRAIWALARVRHPGGAPALLKGSTDTSPVVRFWAMRGLALPALKDSTVTPEVASARLRQAVHDPDRRVRTEAVRALATHADAASIAALGAALASPDNWLSTSAADNTIARPAGAALALAPQLIEAAKPGKPLSLRIYAMQTLAPVAPDEARAIATALADDTNATAKSAAASVIRTLDAAAARAAAQASGQAPTAGRGGAPGAGRGQAPAPPALVARPDAEYRALVTRFIVPDYDGQPRPHVVFDTPRGPIEMEIFVGDAPFGAEYLFDVIEKGQISGTEFGRVVPNFVDQQNAIRQTGRLRDEVNRRGLLANNLSWASAGLDTGRPGYTLGTTPQPHNEGNFTTLGRIVKGMNAMEHIELGDAITGARVVKSATRR